MMKNTGGDAVAAYGLAGLDPTDASGAITGASAAVAPANPKRTGYQLQNNSTAVIWINDQGAAAVAGAASAIQVPVGGTYTTPPGMAPKAAIAVIGTAAAGNFTYREW